MDHYIFTPAKGTVFNVVMKKPINNGLKFMSAYFQYNECYG